MAFKIKITKNGVAATKEALERADLPTVSTAYTLTREGSALKLKLDERELSTLDLAEAFDAKGAADAVKEIVNGYEARIAALETKLKELKANGNLFSNGDVDVVEFVDGER